MSAGGAEPAGESSGMLARVRELFAEALELPAGQRTEFLTRVCGADAALEREVRSLLAYVEKTTFAEQLESGAEALRGLGAELGAPPERIGEFRIVRFLASGGMGRVYEAEQERPKRRVALKILGHGGADPVARRRFEREADLLAALDHPGIARIYAAGVEVRRGPFGALELPWLAMELVEDARDLTRHAREEALPLRARVELLAAVCDAVQAGHRSGVVHRDLKPANLLVDRTGRVRVIDFGVACLADAEAARRTLATATGALIGTLQYMAPEQIAGADARLDTRTDVYALGVVLHELVSGALPYESGSRSLPDLARSIRDEPPRRLSASAPGVPADLDAIAWRALEKEPARRYENAAELAADLHRFLRGEPVLARPPSAARAALFFARRHKLLVGATAVLLCVTSAAAIVSARYARDAEEARAAAEGERDAARFAELAAREAGARAQRLFASQLDLSLAFVFDYHGRLRAVDGTLALQRDMIAKAIENLERLQAEAGADREVRTTLARAVMQLADAQGNPAVRSAGDVAGARRSLERAERLVEELAAETALDVEQEKLRAEIAAKRGDLELQGGRDPAAANAHYERAAAALEALLPRDPSVALPLASLATRRAELAQTLRESASRDVHLERATALLDPYLAAYPESAKAWRASLQVAMVRAFGYGEARDLDGAEQEYLRAHACAERLLALEPEDPTHRFAAAQVELALGDLAAARGEHARALERQRQAAQTFAALLAAEPKDAAYRDRLARARFALGQALFALGRGDAVQREAAREAMASAVELWSELEARGALLRSSAPQLGSARELLRLLTR